MKRIALGTVQFGLEYGIANKNGQVSKTEAKRIVQLAAAGGIDTFDTAMTYGDSETCLGEIGVPTDCKLITKLPGIPKACSNVKEWCFEQISTSLSKLCVDKLYGLLLHHPSQLLSTDGNELYWTLQSLKDKGLVDKIGVSIYDPNELEHIIRLYRFDLVQVPFNLLDQRIESSGWLYRLKDADIEIHTRSVFLQGLLLMSRSAIPCKFNKWSNLWDKWHNWLLNNDINAVVACLALPLTFPEIDRVVVGADNVSQLDEIMKSVEYTTVDLPDLRCDSQNLINPSFW